MYYIRLLGAVGVQDGSGQMKPAGGRNPASVLAHLALADGRLLTAEALIDKVWDRPGKAARNAIHGVVSGLRKDFGEELIQGGKVGYSLSLDVARVDVLEAEQLLGDARRAASAGLAGQALAAAEAVAALFVGEPLAGLRTIAAGIERQRALALRDAALVLQADSLRLVGRPAEAVELIRDLAAADGAPEPALRVLLEALADADRPNEALRLYERFRRRVAEEGGDPSPALQAVFARLLDPGGPTPPAQVVAGRAGPPRAPLPPAGAPILGRDRELAALAGLLAAGHRLITLVGTGGIGKTRLAVAAAAQAGEERGSTVLFADLTLAREPAELVPVVASAFGAAGTDVAAVLAALRDSRLGPTLVVLDNAEHVLEAVAALAGELLAVPSATLLVTSRSLLRLRDEYPWGLDGLRPDAGDDPATELLARSAGLGPAQADAEGDALRELAARADGVPLVLELLAAELRRQSAAELLVGLADALPGLTDDARDRPARHLSFAATVDWSLRRTSARTREALGALTLLCSTFDLDAAAAVLAAAVPDVEPRRLVLDLVDRSLLQRVPGPGPARYRLLEPIRRCAAASDLVPEPSVAAHRGHAAYYLGLLAEAGEERASGSGMGAVAALGRAEEANLRAAAEWCLAHDPDRAFEALASLQWAWYGLNRMTEVLRWTERARAAATAGPARARIAVVRLTMLTLLRQGATEWDALCAEIEPHADGFDDAWHHRWARACADVCSYSGDVVGALDRLAGSRPRTMHERVGVAARRVETLMLAGRHAEAQFQLDLFTGLVSLAGPAEDLPRLYRQIWVSALHGHLALERGRFDEADVRCREISGRIQQAQKLCAAPVLDEWACRLTVHQAWIALADGSPSTAARLVAEAIGGLEMPSIRLEALAAAGLALRGQDRPADAEWVTALVAGLAPENLRYVYPYKRDRVLDLLAGCPVPPVADGSDTNARLIALLAPDQ